MEKQFTCIICPRGCSLTIDNQNNVVGNTCPRGAKYALSEVTNPTRSITSTVRVVNRKDTVVSVKTSDNIPKNKIFEVMEEINKAKVNAPCKIGQIVIENVLGLGVNIILTKNID